MFAINGESKKIIEYIEVLHTAVHWVWTIEQQRYYERHMRECVRVCLENTVQQFGVFWNTKEHRVFSENIYRYSDEFIDTWMYSLVILYPDVLWEL
jgi:hypothetical protein